MRKNQEGHTPRAKLKRDLKEQERIRDKKKQLTETERDAAIKQWITRRLELSAADMKRRSERWLAMGCPELTSPEWRAELALLKAKERQRKPRVPPSDAAIRNWVARQPQQFMHEIAVGPPSDAESLHRYLMVLTGRQAAGLPVTLLELPGQNLQGKSREDRAEAARLYRWLWRHFPGALKACGDELREAIREAGGVA